MSKWQPIESVPDGVPVLLFGGDTHFVGWFQGTEFGFAVETTHPISEEAVITPTHWMQLPEPPND